MDQNMQSSSMSGGLLELIDELWVLIRENKSGNEAIPIGNDSASDDSQLLELDGAAGGALNENPPTATGASGSTLYENPELNTDENNTMPPRSEPDGAEEPESVPSTPVMEATDTESSGAEESTGESSVDASKIKKSGT